MRDELLSSPKGAGPELRLEAVEFVDLTRWRWVLTDDSGAFLPDRVTATDLTDLLDLARERVKLVTVAACWSAATPALS